MIEQRNDRIASGIKHYRLEWEETRPTAEGAAHHVIVRTPIGVIRADLIAPKHIAGPCDDKIRLTPRMFAPTDSSIRFVLLNPARPLGGSGEIIAQLSVDELLRFRSYVVGSILGFIVSYLDRVRDVLNSPADHESEFLPAFVAFGHDIPTRIGSTAPSNGSNQPIPSQQEPEPARHAPVVPYLSEGCYTPYANCNTRVSMTAVIAYAGIKVGDLVFYDAVAWLIGTERPRLLSAADLDAAIFAGKLKKRIDAEDIVRTWPERLGVR